MVEPLFVRRVRQLGFGTLSREDAEAWLRESVAEPCYHCDEDMEYEDCSCLDLFEERQLLTDYLERLERMGRHGR